MQVLQKFSTSPSVTPINMHTFSHESSWASLSFGHQCHDKKAPPRPTKHCKRTKFKKSKSACAIINQTQHFDTPTTFCRGHIWWFTCHHHQIHLQYMRNERSQVIRLYWAPDFGGNLSLAYNGNQEICYGHASPSIGPCHQQISIIQIIMYSI